MHKIGGLFLTAYKLAFSSLIALMIGINAGFLQTNMWVSGFLFIRNIIILFFIYSYLNYRFEISKERLSKFHQVLDMNNFILVTKTMQIPFFLGLILTILFFLWRR